MSMDFGKFGSDFNPIEKIRQGRKKKALAQKQHVQTMDQLKFAADHEAKVNRMIQKSETKRHGMTLASQERMQTEALGHQRDLHSMGHTQQTEHFNIGFGFAREHPTAQVSMTLPGGGGFHVTPAPSAPAEEQPAGRARRKKGEMIEEPMFTEKGNIPKKLQ